MLSIMAVEWRGAKDMTSCISMLGETLVCALFWDQQEANEGGSQRWRKIRRKAAAGKRRPAPSILGASRVKAR